MANNSTTHLDWLDVAKGIGIILVVIGHCMFPKHILIDSFHMPLFFFLAGLTMTARPPFMDFAKKKMARIMLPFCFWWTLTYLFGFPIGPLWFLYTLFFAQLIVLPLIRTKSPLLILSIAIALSMLLWGQHSCLGLLPGYLGRMGVAAIYILVGFCVSH